MSDTFEKYDIQLKNGNRAAMSTTADQVYHEETGMSAAAELSALQGSLATVETTSTASKAYAVGDYLVYTGVLYKVTVAIASGGTITPGTNCTATKLADSVAVSENFLQATISSEQTLASGSSILTLDTISASNGGLLTLSGGKIVIGNGVHNVLVSAAIFTASFSSTGGSSYIWGIVQKNGADTVDSISTIPTGAAYQSVVIPGFIIPVSSGDQIALKSDTLIPSYHVRSNVKNTYLMVKAID